jgi:hypothetical protein
MAALTSSVGSTVVATVGITSAAASAMTVTEKSAHFGNQISIILYISLKPTAGFEPPPHTSVGFGLLDYY